MNNMIAKSIRAVSIAVIVLGVIGSFVTADGDPRYFSTLLTSLLLTAGGGLVLLGFSEVIELLDVQAETSLRLEKKVELLMNGEKMTKNGPRPVNPAERRCAKCDSILPAKMNTCPKCHHYNG